MQNNNQNDRGRHNLRILSYNVFMRPFVHTNKHGDYKWDRLYALLNDDRFMSCDIVALQEMFSLGSRRFRFLIDQCCCAHSRLDHHPFLDHVSMGAQWFPSGKLIDSGLVILSKFPIVEKDSFIFTRGKHIDGWCTKGVLSALIQIDDNNCQLLVITTHTQAVYGSEDELNRGDAQKHSMMTTTTKERSYFEIQKSQLREMKRFLLRKRQQHPTVPIVLLGDFNINARLFDESPDDSLAAVSCTEEYRMMMRYLSWYTDENGNGNNLVVIQPSSTGEEQQQQQAEPSTVTNSLLCSNRNNSSGEQQAAMQTTAAMTTETTRTNDWRDLVYEFQGKHPVTFADGTWNDELNRWETVDTCLTHPLTYCARYRLDYIFYHDPTTANVSSATTPTVKPVAAQVEPFFVTGHSFTQLSDHYAVTCTLEIR